MVFVAVEDFYEKTRGLRRMSREEEKECAGRMKAGDSAAREKLIQSYLPAVAGHIKTAKPHMQTLGLVLYCVQALEKAVDTFDFMQDSEPFAHRLSWALRQAVVNYIVK